MLEGDGPIIDGSLKSTTVLQSSLACHTRNDATAVVHTHSPAAAAVSLLTSGGGYLVHRGWLRSFGIVPRSLVVASRAVSDSGSGGRSSTLACMNSWLQSAATRGSAGCGDIGGTFRLDPHQRDLRYTRRAMSVGTVILFRLSVIGDEPRSRRNVCRSRDSSLLDTRFTDDADSLVGCLASPRLTWRDATSDRHGRAISGSGEWRRIPRQRRRAERSGSRRPG